MRAIILAAIFITSSFGSAYSSEVKVGYEFCKKFTKDSVSEGFAGRSLTGRLLFQANPFLNDKDASYNFLTIREKVTASMNAMCDEKKENVTLADMRESVGLECQHECAKAFNPVDKKEPLLGIGMLKRKANREAGERSEVCQTICTNADNELDLVEKGMKLKNKPSAAPDCTDVVINSSRTKVKSITIDLDKLNAEAKTQEKKTLGK